VQYIHINRDISTKSMVKYN